MDMYTQSWKSTSEKLDGVAYGLKWMVSEKFAIGGGMANETYKGNIADVLDNIENYSIGLEFGLWMFHLNTTYLYRSLNYKDTTLNDDATVEDSIHIDLSMVF
jgi:hypothetical protein